MEVHSGTDVAKMFGISRKILWKILKIMIKQDLASSTRSSITQVITLKYEVLVSCTCHRLACVAGIWKGRERGLLTREKREGACYYSLVPRAPLTQGLTYRIYSIKRPGHLFNFWTFRVGAYSRWALIRGWALIKFFYLQGGRLFEVGRLIEQIR